MRSERHGARVFLAVIVAWAILLALVFISTNASPAWLRPPFPSPDGGTRKLDAGTVYLEITDDGLIRSGDSW